MHVGENLKQENQMSRDIVSRFVDPSSFEALRGARCVDKAFSHPSTSTWQRPSLTSCVTFYHSKAMAC